MNLIDLKKPFLPKQVSWRVGSTNADKSKGMALAYIDARDVQDRLDEVCGVAGWQCRYIPMHDKKTVCEIGISCPVSGGFGGPRNEWIWKSDGAGDSDIEAEKGALSDAFKRAAVRWGIGRYLYDLESPWVALEPAGKSFKIAAHEHKRLEAMLSKGAEQAPREAVAAEVYAPAHIKAHSKPSSDITLDEDPDGQVKAWCDREIHKWAAFTRLPEMLMWSDEREAEIHRLLKKSPLMHRYLMDKYEAKKDEILKVSK
jgi:hypothetical protein